MTNTRTRLFAPLVHLAALLLLLEEWCWDVGARLGAGLARWPLLAAVESRVRLLPPWAALCLFLLPGVLLLPVKLLALMAIAHGHAVSGVLTIVVAKLGGAAVVARLYALTLPTLKNRWVGRLRASHAYLEAGRLLRSMRLALRQWRLRRVRRRSSRAWRVLRRFAFQWRARRR
jgi:hypothetical protein